MMKAMPKEGLRTQKVDESFDFKAILSNYKEADKIGHLFKVDLEAPTDGLALALNEQYCPVFVRSEVSPKMLSPYQLFSKNW